MSTEAFVERATEAANEARELSNELVGLAVEASSEDLDELTVVHFRPRSD